MAPYFITNPVEDLEMDIIDRVRCENFISVVDAMENAGKSVMLNSDTSCEVLHKGKSHIVKVESHTCGIAIESGWDNIYAGFLPTSRINRTQAREIAKEIISKLNKR